MSLQQKVPKQVDKCMREMNLYHSCHNHKSEMTHKLKKKKKVIGWNKGEHFCDPRVNKIKLHVMKIKVENVSFRLERVFTICISSKGLTVEIYDELS